MRALIVLAAVLACVSAWAGVPAGATMLFQSSCPSGWTNYDMTGRVPVGVGSGYILSSAGGHEFVVLGANQLPTHSSVLSGATVSGTTDVSGAHFHAIPTGASSGGSLKIRGQTSTGTDFGATTATDGAHSHTFSGSVSGGTATFTNASQQSVDVRMPYVVWRYCSKDTDDSADTVNTITVLLIVGGVLMFAHGWNSGRG